MIRSTRSSGPFDEVRELRRSLGNLYFVQFLKEAWASEFRSHGQASRLSILCHYIINVEFKSFLLKYFCGARLASLQRSCIALRDNGSRSLHRFFIFLFYKPYGIYIFPPIFPSLLRNFILSFFPKYRPLLYCLIFGTLLSPGPSH